MEEEEFMQKIDIIGEEITKAENFAKAMVETVNYSDSGQVKKEIIEYNIFIGKIGEEAASKGFKNLGYKVKGPDYNIYKPKEKRWKYDLLIKNDKGQILGVHVMTQASSQAKYYGINWMIQSISSGRKDPILNDPDSLVCLVECDDSRRCFSCIVYKPYKMEELKITDAMGKYRGIKKVIKKEDLPCFADTKDKTEQVTIDNAWD